MAGAKWGRMGASGEGESSADGFRDTCRGGSNPFHLPFTHSNIFQLLDIMLNYLQKKNVKE